MTIKRLLLGFWVFVCVFTISPAWAPTILIQSTPTATEDPPIFSSQENAMIRVIPKEEIVITPPLSGNSKNVVPVKNNIVLQIEASNEGHELRAEEKDGDTRKPTRKKRSGKTRKPTREKRRGKLVVKADSVLSQNDQQYGQSRKRRAIEDLKSFLPTDDALTPLTRCSHVKKYYDHRWLMLVVNCPASWTIPATADLCRSWEFIHGTSDLDDITMLPVQDLGGRVYANVFCALCNGIRPMYIYPWETTLSCNSKPPTSLVSRVTFKLPGLEKLVNLPIPTACERSILPRFPETIVDCNGGYSNKLSNLRSRLLPSSSILGDWPTFPVSFNILLNFDFSGNALTRISAGQNVIYSDGGSQCRDSETYDSYIGQCRPVKCSQTHQLRAGLCVARPSAPGHVSWPPLQRENLQLLEEIVLVELSANLSPGDYYFYFKDQLPYALFIDQISEVLKISPDRISHFNISFEFGFMKGSPVRVSRLTPEQYKKLNSEDAMDDMNVIGERKEPSPEHKNLVQTGTEEPSPKHKNQVQTGTEEPSPESKNLIQTETKESSPEHKNLVQIGTEESRPEHKNLVRTGTEEPSPGSLRQDTDDILQPPTPYDNQETREEDEADDYYAYYSQTYNGTNERFLVPSKSNKPLVMKVSFFLLPSNNPFEQKSIDLAKKITQLVIERELKLQVSGKDITVLDSLHADQSDINDSGEPFCKMGTKLIVWNHQFKMIYNGNATFLYMNKTDTYLPVGLFDLWISIKGNNINDQTEFTYFEQHAFVCNMPQIKQRDCRRIHLTKDEYRVINKAKTIVFEENEYDFYSYEVLNATTELVAICVPQSYDKYERNDSVGIENVCGSEFVDVLRADGYLTLILGRMSAAALALVLITYCLFKNLRNLPGCNTINLTVSLLIAQIVFTEGMGASTASTPWLCYSVAITEHFTRLAAQFWMNVISYDVHRTFSKPTVSTQFRTKRRQFLKYFLYAWGVPFLIVGICAAIDFSHIFPDIEIGYGGVTSMSQTNAEDDTNSTDRRYQRLNDISADLLHNETVVPGGSSNGTTSGFSYSMQSTCWISNPLANLIAFGAPIFIILIVNCVLFVRTIINISRTSKSNTKDLAIRRSISSSNSTTRRADVMLYIRMATVMGISWVFSLIWTIVRSFAKVYTKTVCIVILSQGMLSTIFNVSQGIFIFIAFVCNRRVFSLYLELFACVRGKLCPRAPKGILYSVSESVSTNSVASSSSPIIISEIGLHRGISLQSFQDMSRYKKRMCNLQ